MRADETNESTAGTDMLDIEVQEAQIVAQLGQSAVDTAHSGALGFLGGGVTLSGVFELKTQLWWIILGQEGEE